MPDQRSGPVRDLVSVVGWLAVLWTIFFIDVALRTMAGFSLPDHVGLRPREIHGLWGILCAHALHANLAHIVANSLALVVLGWLSCRYSRKLTVLAVIASMLISGGFTWLVGSWGETRPMVHIGASGVIFGLIGFLLANAIFRFDLVAIIVGILVGWLFIGALPGMLPVDQGGPPVSWEMHLGGFVGGVMASWSNRKKQG
jgi:membrane associated rhomboid family serine protease